MASGRFKSRTFRRVKVRVPGNRTAMHYRKRAPGQMKCARCKGTLKGVPRLRPYRIQNIPKSQKRPERPFGGVLCSKCSRLQIKEKLKAY